MRGSGAYFRGLQIKLEKIEKKIICFQETKKAAKRAGQASRPSEQANDHASSVNKTIIDYLKTISAYARWSTVFNLFSFLQALRGAFWRSQVQAWRFAKNGKREREGEQSLGVDVWTAEPVC